jgi:hypothetical protein
VPKAAALSCEVAARSVRSPCRAAAIRHSSQTVALAKPRPAAGDRLPDPIAKFGSALLEAAQLEPAQNGAVIGGEHVEGTDAPLSRTE